MTTSLGLERRGRLAGLCEVQNDGGTDAHGRRRGVFEFPNLDAPPAGTRLCSKCSQLTIRDDWSGAGT